MSKPNLETIISDLQPKLKALEPLEIASEYAKVLAERNDLKTENDSLRAENQTLKKSSQCEFDDLKADHKAVLDENQTHREKFLELKETLKRLNDKLGESKARIATLENENEDLAEKYRKIYKKNEKLVLENEAQSKQLETFRAIEKLILDQKNLNDPSDQFNSRNKNTKQENALVNIKQEIIGLPNMPTSINSTSPPRRKALVFICEITNYNIDHYYQYISYNLTFNIINYVYGYLYKSHSKTSWISASRSEASEKTEDLNDAQTSRIFSHKKNKSHQIVGST